MLATTPLKTTRRRKIFAFHTATDFADGLAEGKFRSVELIETHLARIGALNMKLHAFSLINGRAARNQAILADKFIQRGEQYSPLHGLPVTIKDGFHTAYLRTTASLPLLFHYHPSTDAPTVARWKKAGAIIIGKTNMPTLSLDFQSISPIYGIARNPHDRGHTAGGSTGGGAAAIAAGLSALELGNDYAGSLRIPAHCCGVFSLKPTENTISSRGYITNLPGKTSRIQHMISTGVIARSVEDLQLGWRYLAGPDEHDPDVDAIDTTPLAPQPLSAYRIAWTDDFGVPISDETRASMHMLVQRLHEAGAHVEQRLPTDFDPELAWRTWGHIGGYEMTGGLHWVETLFLQAAVKGLYGDDIFAKSLREGIRHQTRYEKALDVRLTLQTEVDDFLSRWDAWLVPVMVTPAFPHQRPGKSMTIDGYTIPYMTACAAYTTPFNVTGHPVVTIPLPRQGTLPIGVQVVGRRFNDRHLLAVAKAITAITGDFRPPESNDI